MKIEEYSVFCRDKTTKFKDMQKKKLRGEDVLDDREEKEQYSVAMMNRIWAEINKDDTSLSLREDIFHRMFMDWVEMWGKKDLGYLEDIMSDWDLKF